MFFIINLTTQDIIEVTENQQAANKIAKHFAQTLKQNIVIAKTIKKLVPLLPENIEISSYIYTDNNEVIPE